MEDESERAPAVARILVVEDEGVVARDLADTLGELGYLVIGMVASGEDAVTSARAHLPDAILMDVRLAGTIDGIQAAAQIHAERDVPIIYLTAHADDDTLGRAKRTDPLGYLVKPFNSAELRCAIEIALHRHEIDARLRRREEWLVATLRATGHGVIATPVPNPVAEALSGWSHDEAVGQALDEILTVVTHRPGVAIEDRVREPQVVHVPMPNALEERNADLEARVLERTCQLEVAYKELEAFSYSVAHDLRAPLRGIAGFSQILIEDHAANLGPEGLSTLHHVRSATARMATLIEDLLRLSRASSAPLETRSVDLSGLATKVTAKLRALAPDRQVVVAIEPGLTVEGDAGLIRILLENVLGNAWKFTALAAEPRIELGAVLKDGAQVIYVRDNGAGFDPAFAERLFGAFQRFHTAAEFEGTGIGLAIVQRIINRHGGRIWAESQVGHGATFYLAL